MNEKVEIAMVAFLNTMGGIIYIGITDESQVIGVNQIDENLRSIADIITDKINPSASEFIRAYAKEVNHKQVIVIDVKKSTYAIHYLDAKELSPKGAYLRIGTSNRSMTKDEIYQRFLKDLNYREPQMTMIESRHRTLTFEVIQIKDFI